MSEKTMTDEDFDLAVGHVTSFYQSARAKAKKQVAHWMGKFMIVKAENYTLRRKINNLQAAVDHHRSMEARNGLRAGQLKTQVARLEVEAGTALKEWDKKDAETNQLKAQVVSLQQELKEAKEGVCA